VPRTLPFIVILSETGKPDKTRHFGSASAAEQCARKWVNSHQREAEITLEHTPIAFVALDALDRKWTNVLTCPGEPALL
jgi:hypothetical protein